MKKIFGSLLALFLFLGLEAKSEEAPDDYLNETPMTAQYTDGKISVSPNQKFKLKININRRQSKNQWKIIKRTFIYLTVN